MSIGFRVYTKRILPPQEVIDEYKKLAAANVSDCMKRSSALSSDFRLMSRPFTGAMAGPALTVNVRPGDNLMLHKALNLAQEGDIIVVSSSGVRGNALYGAVMHGFGCFKKIGGIIIDSPIRDIDQLYDMGVPVYATGITPGGPHKEGPGEVNTPIACGGVHICPGDIILGDCDGVVVVPRQDAAALLPVVQKFAQNDQAKTQASRLGTLDRSWVDKSLNEKGCEIIDAAWQ